MSSIQNRSGSQQLFLPSQQLSQLNITDPKKLAEFLDLGRDKAKPEAPDRTVRPESGLWHVRTRKIISRLASCARAPRRVALMCDAGLGKTTNMEWIQHAIVSESRGRQIPFLFRLHQEMDLETMQNAVTKPRTLMAWMAGQIEPTDLDISLDENKYLHLISRLRRDGRITLLIDGLDHVMSNESFMQKLALFIESPYWESCPIWVSGRPEAFRQRELDLTKDRRWKILRVEPFAAAQSRDFLQWYTGHAWYDAFPPESRNLLAVPRLLRLIASILQRQRPIRKADRRSQQEEIRALDLDTPAGVYYRAYFEIGDPKATQVDSHGLLAQGLRDPKLALVGLDKGFDPDDGNMPDRVERIGLELGATAFSMMARGTDCDNPEPNWSGATETWLLRNVGKKLETLRHSDASDYKRDLHALPTAADYQRDLGGLRQMNNLSLDFLLFNNDERSKHLVFHDRTVQAFFAAYWAMKYGTEEDLKLITHWICVVDANSNHSPSFDEFWQFAAQMPNRALRRLAQDAIEDDYQRWLNLFSPCYLPPPEIRQRNQGPENGAYEWAQWHHSMAYHSIKSMKNRDLATVNRWRALWLELEDGRGTTTHRRIFGQIIEGFRRCPKDPTLIGPQKFIMGSPETEEHRHDDEDLHAEEVEPFLTHKAPVTNEQFELYDPDHKQLRDEYSRNANQPAIYVSFWEAACFALWTGNRLPTEVEWEYACRAGTTTAYCFGDDPKELGKYAWFSDNSGGKTHAVGKKEPNAWDLFDMQGNVWEWCDSVYEAGALARVLRGGSWGSNGGSCRSAYRRGDEPDARSRYYGFRLAAVPCNVGAKSSRSGGDGAAGVVESE